MRLPLSAQSLPPSLFLILLATTSSLPTPVSARTPSSSPSTHTNIFRRATESFHSYALKHSKGLARDLRVAFGGLRSPGAGGGHVLLPRGSGAGTQCVVTLGTEDDGAGSSNSTGTGAGGSGAGTGTGTGSKTGTKTATSAASTSTGTTTLTSNWKINQTWEGNSFFSGWDFFTAADPTNGNVNYLSGSDAASNNLTYINDAGNAVMRVDTTETVSTNRDSVRITTEFSFNQGLVILDAVHMPTGCGTWPAFWSDGPNWPAGGEIDIVEGVNDYTNNQATVHTNPGCTLSSSTSSTLGISGTVVSGTNCAAAQTDNSGCGVRAAQTDSFGAAFNGAGGGVYAMKLDSTGVGIYFWTRSSIPEDITQGAPDPDSWGTPMAEWAAASCNPETYFYSQNVIFDTTFCGDWAGSVWDSTGVPGQDESCASRTGVSTCAAFVQGNGSAFEEAYWEVKSVKIYSSTSS